MERTQIYLTRAESAALDREAARTGRSRSQLIRDAIDRDYLGRQNGDLRAALAETAGAWKGRRGSGASYVHGIRRGRLSRLHRS